MIIEHKKIDDKRIAYTNQPQKENCLQQIHLNDEQLQQKIYFDQTKNLIGDLYNDHLYRKMQHKKIHLKNQDEKEERKLYNNFARNLYPYLKNGLDNQLHNITTNHQKFQKQIQNEIQQINRYNKYLLYQKDSTFANIKQIQLNLLQKKQERYFFDQKLNQALIKTNKIKNFNYEDYFRFRDQKKDQKFNHFNDKQQSSQITQNKFDKFLHIYNMNKYKVESYEKKNFDSLENFQYNYKNRLDLLQYEFNLRNKNILKIKISVIFSTKHLLKLNLFYNDIFSKKRRLIQLQKSVFQKVEIKDYNKQQTKNGQQKNHTVLQKDLGIDLKMNLDISLEEDDDNKDQLGLKNDMNENAFLLLEHIQQTKN